MCYGSSEYVEVVPYSIALMTESSEVIIDANKRGALAEQLVQGVHRTRLPGPVEEVIEGHLREEYASALSSDPSDTYIHEADTPGYLLFTSDNIRLTETSGGNRIRPLLWMSPEQLMIEESSITL